MVVHPQLVLHFGTRILSMKIIVPRGINQGNMVLLDFGYKYNVFNGKLIGCVQLLHSLKAHELISLS